jgi:hypothetical protein
VVLFLGFLFRKKSIYISLLFFCLYSILCSRFRVQSKRMGNSQSPSPSHFLEVALPAAGAIPPANNLVLATVAGTYQLPAIVGLVDGAVVTVKNTSAGSVTVAPASGSTDTLEAGYTTLSAGQSLKVVAIKTGGPAYPWKGLLKPQ